MRFVLPMALTILVVVICAPGAQAAPVTITSEAETFTMYAPPLVEDLLESDTLGTTLSDLALAGLCTTGGTMSATQPTPQPTPEPEPQPEPEPAPQPQLVGPAAVTSLGPTGGTMSSTSVTSLGGSSSSVPPADLQTNPNLLLATSGELLADSDWLFIPPRFLDGIFRPPRHIVSL